MTRNVSRNWTGTGFASSRAATVDLLGDGNKISFSALPGVARELQSIFSTSGILTGEVLSDAGFTKDAFYNAMKQRRPLVHIASHFSFRPGDDSRSFLLLGEGFLTLSEMKKQEKLFHGVELLTLSACNTAATQPDASGKEIDGFAELAQRLGAGAVMATLWQVSDNSTPWLMRDFYAARQGKSDTTKAEAIRNAQLALLNGTAGVNPVPPESKKDPSTSNAQLLLVPEETETDNKNQIRSDVIRLDKKKAPRFERDEKKPFAHPYYWSPFVLIGNWK